MGRPKLRVTPEAAALLNKLFYDLKMFFARDKLYEIIQREHPDIVKNGKLSRRMVQLWLDQQESFAMHRKWQKDKTIQRRTPKGAFKTVTVDLKDMSTQAWPPGVPEQEKWKWIMSATDVFTKKLYAVPMRNNTNQSVVQAMKTILNKMARKPSVIASHNGSEFVSAEFAKLMKDKDIKQVFGLPYKPQSQAAVERMNLVIARMISLYKKSTGKSDWPVVLPELVTNYNKTFHSVIGKSPDEAEGQALDDDEEGTEDTREKIFNKAHAGDHNVNRIARKLYKKGDKVQIRLEIQKSATYRWSSQHFIVDQVRQSSYGPGYQRTMYKLVDPRTGEALPNLHGNDQLQIWHKPTREAHFVDDQVLCARRTASPNGLQGIWSAWRGRKSGCCLSGTTSRN